MSTTPEHLHARVYGLKRDIDDYHLATDLAHSDRRFLGVSCAARFELKKAIRRDLESLGGLQGEW